MGEAPAEFNFFLNLKECYTDMKWKRIFLKIYFYLCFISFFLLKFPTQLNISSIASSSVHFTKKLRETYECKFNEIHWEEDTKNCLSVKKKKSFEMVPTVLHTNLQSCRPGDLYKWFRSALHEHLLQYSFSNSTGWGVTICRKPPQVTATVTTDSPIGWDLNLLPAICSRQNLEMFD